MRQRDAGTEEEVVSINDKATRLKRDKDGNPINKPDGSFEKETFQDVAYKRVPKNGAVKIPDGVAYDRFVAFLVDGWKMHEEKIADLEARLLALETRSRAVR